MRILADVVVAVIVVSGGGVLIVGDMELDLLANSRSARQAKEAAYLIAAQRPR